MRVAGSWLFTKQAWGVVAILSLLFCVLTVQPRPTGATDSESPAWTHPRAMTIKRASAIAGAQSEPNFLNNLDCSLVTYRLVTDSTMRTGCFTETAFGLLDSDMNTVIFNGTDEGLPLIANMPHQVLAPWPRALNLVSLNATALEGSYIGLYKNPLGVMRDQRNVLGQLTGKELTAPPEILLRDPSGNPLVVNPQTMAFSDGGSWLVIETMNDSFVRINLATLSVTAFARAYRSTGGPSMLKSRVAISDDGRFIAIANDIAAEFKIYDLATCNGVVDNLRPQTCQSYDYWPFAKQQVNGLRSIRHLRFINDGLLSFEATSSNPDNDGIYELAPAAGITSFTDYIGLGDSYTSGEGAFDYLAGTDSDNNMCHLSSKSYPLLLTHDLFSNTGGHSVACSGAVINDIANTSNTYRGQVKGALSLEQLQESQPLLLESIETNFAPGYVAQQRFIKRWQPRIATVSVGGNDIGFGDILQKCVEPHISRHFSDNTCYNTYEDRLEILQLIDRVIPRWTALYKQLRREAPNAQLYAIGYPQIADDRGSCALNVQLSKSELEFAAGVVDYLNNTIKKAPDAAGVTYVDIGQALVGHRLCETAGYNVAVNGLTAGRDAGFLGIRLLGKESYHPNALGQSLIEQAILKQTHNLSAKPVSNSPVSNPALLNAPKSGRTVYALMPDNTLTSGVAKRGSSLAIQADGVRNGLAPNSVFTIHLDGPAGPMLGTIASDSTGSLHGTVAIPGNSILGGHTVDVTGQGQGSEPTDITQPIIVPVSDTDSDGDGIEDITDTCPGAVNSGQDSDHDGVDDICDNLIGSPPAPPAQGGTSQDAPGPSPGPPGSPSSGAGQAGSTSNNKTISGGLHITPTSTVFKARNKDDTELRLPPTYPAKSLQQPQWPPLRIIYWLPWFIAVISVCLVLAVLETYIKSRKFRLQ